MNLATVKKILFNDANGNYFEDLLNSLPFAIYTTDSDGNLTFYNRAAATLWGREPEIGTDKWCGSWKIYNSDGSFLPHDQCPMGVALKEKREVRGAEAIAERPDGTRFPFTPYPTPLYDSHGTLIGAVNLLVDVTEQKQAREAVEKALDETREKEKRLANYNDDLKDFLNSSPIGMHWVGPDGTILWANKAELEMLGYREEEYVGQNITRFHADKPVIDDILQRLTSQEELRNYKARLVCKDGSIKDVLVSSNVKWEGEKFIHTRCFTIDVTAERETSLAHARLAAIVESSDDAVISKNFDGIITSWNSSAERIFGYSEKEAVGQHISLIIPNDRLDEEDEIISKLRRGERIEHFETLRRAKDGCLLNTSITVSPIRNSEGVIVGASKVARDITERIRTEAQLKEERDTLETLNRLSPKLASSLDLHTLVQLAIEEATKITGAQSGAFLYKNSINEDLFKPYAYSGEPDAFSVLGSPAGSFLYESVFEGEGTILKRDLTTDPEYNALDSGVSFRSYLAAPVISRTGEVIGGFFFAHADANVFMERDARIVEGIAALAAVGIDNARLYEEVKLGQEKAEEASKAKTDFLATMSHEIRTPMNAIIGLSSILSMTEPMTPKQRKFIKTLKSSADSLLSLINDLLDISKIEARTVELEQVPFSLAQIVEENVGMMSARAREKGLKFLVDIKNVQGRTFIGDPTRLRQIIANLLSNAVKFTEQGSISIRVLSEKASESNTSKVSIVIEDTGIGIPEEKLDKVFEKFVQADTSINRKYGGTGLGLSITKRLVNLMRGTISVESEVGKGTIFTVSLPLVMAADHQKAEDSLSLAEEKIPNQKKLRILLVEDHEPNILVAGTFLENLGYDYTVARNGMEALEKVKTMSFDAVLMDIQMPGINGFETTQLIRSFKKNQESARMPIIGVTAHAMTGDKERCLNAGMDEYMSKPFDLVELKQKLEKLSG